jgi:hypothetical protein
VSEEDIEALTVTLTSHQAAVVKRRVDTLNATIRKKHRGNKTDVRDIFKTQSWVRIDSTLKPVLTEPEITCPLKPIEKVLKIFSYKTSEFIY